MTLPLKPSASHRLISYLWPLRIRHRYMQAGDYLELSLYRNQWQLATEDAIYSDGRRYAPFRLAFKKLPASFFQNLHTCLVLGTGLGSVAQILHHHYNSHIRYTLVELDGDILQWAENILSQKGIRELQAVNGDACMFMKNNTHSYDLICIDVFKGRSVPECILQPDFFEACQKALNPGGYCIMNFIVHETKEWENLQNMLARFFPFIEIITKGNNRILLCRNR